MAREYIIVELVGRVEGDEVVLLDSDGKKITRLARHRAEKTSPQTIEDIEAMRAWRFMLSAAIGGNVQHAKRMNEDPWLTKCGVWTRSITSRVNRPAESKSASDRRKKRWIDSHVSWDVVVELMVQKSRRWLYKAKARQENPWVIWADTVACNVKKRRRRLDHKKEIATQSQAIAWQAERTRIQMRFDWGRIDAAESLARSH